ncbi:MAG: hypothetical protein QXM68_04025 [Candidatus Aenigmatarchaeota archaeon]|nr:hypothetical protein [Candidatus Aenigmarchaeota archaeon]
MERQIWAFDKFWIIWSSCLDRPRTINEIQDFWSYDGNALYQKGLNKSIWKEMLEKGFIESKGKVKVRGVSGDLIYGKTEWIFDFLDENAKKSRVSFENDLPFHILSCIKNRKKLLYYIDTNREVFFMLQRLKILFGDKQNLKNNYELCITAPLITIFNYFIIVTLKKKLKVDLDSILLLSQSLIFTPYFGTNFFSYYKSVIKDLSTKEMPLDLFDEAKVFKLWKDYSKEIMKEVNV